MGARFTAWFDSTCWFCGYPICPGDRVHYVAAKTLCHQGCAEQPTPRKERINDDSSPPTLNPLPG